MTGYAFVLGPCYVCGGIFTYNPVHVPSFSPDGSSVGREPICASCIRFVNQKREEAGLALWPVHPEAYEAAPEHELF